MKRGGARGRLTARARYVDVSGNKAPAPSNVAPPTNILAPPTNILAPPTNILAPPTSAHFNTANLFVPSDSGKLIKYSLNK